MKKGDLFLNGRLTPIMLLNNDNTRFADNSYETRFAYNSYEFIYENKEPKNGWIHISVKANSIQIPTTIPKFYAALDDITISSLFEILNRVQLHMLINVKNKITKHYNIFYDENKLLDISNHKIIKHLMIHKIDRNMYNKIFDKYIKLNEMVS